MLFLSSLSGLGFSLLLASGCSQGSQSLKAPKNIDDAFAVELTGSGQAGKKASPIIGIHRDALEKEFLLQGELIMQAGIASFENLKSRIVAFRKYGSSIYMMEASDGHTVSTDLPQNLVLARFDIISQKRGVYYFNFNEGMSKLFIASDWRAQDFEGSYYHHDWNSVNLDSSYIEEAYHTDTNNLLIRQVAQLTGEFFGVNHQIPIAISYYISPYQSNDNFKTTQSKSFDMMGFFEVAPRLRSETGGTDIFATKWDVSKPIVFSISDNTPKEYIEAIKEGILYWNKAFSKDIVKVNMSPAGVRAPNFFHNIVQWVDWNDAGFAYADAQMDPRSGEILHAQVFMTSVFAFGGIERARALLRRFDFDRSTTASASLPFRVDRQGIHARDPESEGSAKTSSLRIALKGFQKDRLCNYRPSQHFITELSNIVNSDIPDLDRVLLKISQDYVREVVAHEIGHVLGLRHNFSGSLAVNYQNGALDGYYQNYLETGNSPDGIVTSSSVMEYQRFKEGTLAGDQIVKRSEAFEYDKKAISSLYFGHSFSKEEMPLFCTDSHIGVYTDCAVFDGGKSSLAGFKSDEHAVRNSIAYTLMERYIAAKSPPPGYDPIPLAQSTLSPFDFAASVFSFRNRLVNAISQETRYLAVERSFDYINDLNSWQVRAENNRHTAKQLAENGGLREFFSDIPMKEVLGQQKLFFKMLESESYTKGIAAGGSYEFSDDEIAIMRKEAKVFFGLLPIAYFFYELGVLSRIHNVINDKVTDELAMILREKANFYLFSTLGSDKLQLVDPDGNVRLVELPKFLFPYKVRIIAAALLNNPSAKISRNLTWGRHERNKLKLSLKAFLDKGINEDISNIDVDGLPDKAATWVLENRLVLASIQ